ncbi:hypothetical protein [Sulfuriflexus mobilis]
MTFRTLHYRLKKLGLEE